MFQWLSNILCACTSNTSKIIANINQFDQDPLGWSHDLLEHQLGEFSMAAVKANNVTEDRSQLHVGNKALFVGIYHGQNGHEASNFLSTNLCEDLIRNIVCVASVRNNMSENILRQLVAEMEERFMTGVEESNQQQPELAIVGSSCLFCIVWRGRLYIANLGDSRAVLGYLDPFNRLRDRKLVKDHSARNRHIKKELKKLHPKDPTIVTYNFGAWRVRGVSEVSRCIGNAYLKRKPFTLTPSFQVPQSELAPSDFTQPLLSAEPATSSRFLNVNDKFVIFGSGGLWKFLTNRQAAKIVHANPRDGIAKRLLTTALEIAARRNNISYRELRQIPTGHGVIRDPSVSVEGTRRAYHDDISVIVVFFDKKPYLNPTVMPVVTSVPAINSFRDFSDAIHRSPLRYLDLDVLSIAHEYLKRMSDTIHPS
ncbi:Protein phosphatase 2C family protein [Trifolium repens]|nr:Protein phosphatase 2C family protein [Trifolium repens]